MEEVVERLRTCLDGRPRKERYAAALAILKPGFDALLPYLDMVADDDAALQKKTRILLATAREVGRFGSGEGADVQRLRHIWKLGSSLFDVAFENFHQGGGRACGVADALCWLCACALAENGDDVEFHYARFDGLDCPRPPHLVEVFRRMALSRVGIAGFTSDEIDAIDEDRAGQVRARLERDLDALGCVAQRGAPG